MDGNYVVIQSPKSKAINTELLQQQAAAGLILERADSPVNIMSRRHANEHTKAHQNGTIAIASDFRVDGAKSPEIQQKEGVSVSVAARNRKSLATFHRTLNLGSAMGIAIANRKNRCDLGALRRTHTHTDNNLVSPVSRKLA